MLEKIAERIGKNKFIQAVTIASFLGCSTAALAKSGDYLLAEPEKDLISPKETSGENYLPVVPELKIGYFPEENPLSLESKLNWPGTGSFLLAGISDDRPPYLEPKGDAPQKGQKAYYFDPREPEGEKPSYLTPQRENEAGDWSPPPTEKEDSDVFGYVMLGAGGLVTLIGIGTLGGYAEEHTAATGYKTEHTSLNTLSYIMIGSGLLMCGIGLIDILD